MNPIPDRLPSRPLQNWFLAWHLHTGDPVEVIAKGFDLDVEVVADLLNGEVSLMLTTKLAIDFCRRIRVAPAELWSSVHADPLKEPAEFDPPWSEVPTPLAESLCRLR